MPDENNGAREQSFDPTELILPVAYSADGGTLLTLSQYLEEGAEIIPPAKVSAEQWQSLIVAHIQQGPDFKIVSVDAGFIDRDRAVVEIRANSRVGETLQELFRIVIENFLQKADSIRRQVRAST
jgi:hypothetical protein